jgi:aminopeptidase N
MLHAQLFNNYEKFTRQDSLRGSIGPERIWWDVQHYDISVTPDFKTKSISGKTIIRYKVISENHSDYLQIDLQKPLMIDKIFYDNKMYINYPAKPYYNEGNVWHIPLPKTALNSVHSIGISYHGKPTEAINPPWDGGWIFSKDEKGRPWMTVACQGLGASVWYPCKDHQSDEPDLGATLRITVPDSLIAVGNGKLIEKKSNNDGTTIWTWDVKAPVNNYNIVPYIGKYVHFSDSYFGETKKNLSLDYWVLDYNLEKAKKQFGRDVKRMLKAFEYWFGPYPFSEDGYKLVESSHLGMEHQSSIAYGNHYLNGYLGTDRSESGWGMKWDYIIIHESAHEWFANNITTNDIADMWVHEGFANFAEGLFTEYYYGKKAGDEYVQGIRQNINNIKPVIGIYGVNHEGSSDMYDKGANLLHAIRQVIQDDLLFRKILRGLNKDFYHKTVDSKDVESYISKKSGIDFSKIFDQYLRTTKIPKLEYKIENKKITYRWVNCVPGFNMPVRIEGSETWLHPAEAWKTTITSGEIQGKNLRIDRNFYITTKKIE